MPILVIESFAPLPSGISLEFTVDSCAETFGTHLVRSPEGSVVFVKLGDPTLKEEACTQKFFYDQAQQSSNVFRVPLPHVVFYDGCGCTFFAMEAAPTAVESLLAWTEAVPSECAAREERAIAMMANAVNWMLSIEPPKGDSVGPVGGGYMQHSIFAMDKAPIAFATTLALQIYLNKALSRQPGRKKRTVNLTNEKRYYCPSDVELRNFLWDGTELWIVDFQHVNIVPHSFASQYFHRYGNKVVKAVAELINLEPSGQVDIVNSAAGTILQMGTPTYGLDEYGENRVTHTVSV